jgi:hypothetical protein
VSVAYLFSGMGILELSREALVGTKKTKPTRLCLLAPMEQQGTLGPACAVVQISLTLQRMGWWAVVQGGAWVCL